VAIFEGDPGYAIRTVFSATGQTASGPASSTDTNGKGSTGTISGNITGRHISLVYRGAEVYNFKGDVGDDAKGHGVVNAVDGSQRSWTTGAPLKCVSAPEPGTSADGRANVTGDVDMYDAPGGVGNKLPGFLAGDQRVELITCNDDNWCNVITSDGNAVWVWGGFIEH
jgi:hypothetical protein